MKIYRNSLSNAVLNILKKITTDIPSLEELTESLKHYHSNNLIFYENTPGYKRQTRREKLANKVLIEPPWEPPIVKLIRSKYRI